MNIVNIFNLILIDIIYNIKKTKNNNIYNIRQNDLSAKHQFGEELFSPKVYSPKVSFLFKHFHSLQFFNELYFLRIILTMCCLFKALNQITYILHFITSSTLVGNE